METQPCILLCQEALQGKVQKKKNLWTGKIEMKYIKR